MKQITEKFKIHDRYQFEIKYNYTLSSSKPHTNYTVETFFFLPNSLGLNRSTYPAELFYRDLQTYIRFLPPRVSLDKLASKDSGSLYLDLQQCLKISDQSEELAAKAEQKLKMFCNVFRDTARSYMEEFKETLDEEQREDKALRFVTTWKEILHLYRGLENSIPTCCEGNSIASIYRCGDEYLSSLAEKFSFAIIEITRLQNPKLNERLVSPFLAAIRSESTYRERRLLIPVEGPELAEQIIYRQGILKRFFESDLFINTRLKADGGLAMQMTYGFAAGVAMLFATAVAFMAQRHFGNFTFPLFTALVVSYIFKDRLKELMRSWLYARIARKRYDHKTSFSIRGRKIGFSREHFSFQEVDDLDPDVSSLRNQTRLATLETRMGQEQVFCFRKSVRIHSRDIRQHFHDPVPGGVTDIVRFNVQKLLRKMDNPKKSIYLLDGDSYSEVKGRKLYHLNIITKYYSESEVALQRNRVVLSRAGIRSVQEVTPTNPKEAM